MVYTHGDPIAHGAYLAAKNAGREKSINFAGIDGLPREGAPWVEQGPLAGTTSAWAIPDRCAMRAPPRRADAGMG
ncbi:hypothetical protein AWB77_01653 [Caballeronia fortuita]|uniref:Uncharacterized protein n=1 Tax=Caballeronia fortuita TaxID=1777138 RepID=A0A158ADC5_9BURK|nr:hypothetical protein [Caballeronia fortuita]SAK55760.1 hypothetical protein AWB77_01653 [Caballeronia fortuita]